MRLVCLLHFLFDSRLQSLVCLTLALIFLAFYGKSGLFVDPSGYRIRLVSVMKVCVVVCVAGTVLLKIRAEVPAAAIGACDERRNPSHIVASLLCRHEAGVRVVGEP